MKYQHKNQTENIIFFWCILDLLIYLIAICILNIQVPKQWILMTSNGWLSKLLYVSYIVEMNKHSGNVKRAKHMEFC